MSDEQHAHDPAGDLGPMPTPHAEQPDLVPGGPDAIGEVNTDPVVPDVSADANPATEDAPAETREGEDTSTKATESDEGSDEVDPSEEAPV